MAASVSPPPPLLARRYRLEHRIAQGGMAEVWLATDELLTRQVAVKLLKPALAADPVVAERFRREAIAVAGLTHPNIVAVYDTVDEDGRQAVVMQYVPGRSLREMLDEDKRLTPELTIRIGVAVAAALDSAHQAGLVHRDIKPGNILVTPQGRVLLTDFGIAKASSGDGDLTSDNVMMGTAKYLSPEQVRGRRLDGRADLYALGLVLYECLAGRVPFQGGNDAETALARLQRDPTPLLRLRPTLPPGLVDLIHRLLARNPDDRPASGSVVQTALARSLREAPDARQPTTPPKGTGVVRGTPPRGAGAPRATAGAGGNGSSAGNTTGATRTQGTPRPGVRPVHHRDPTPTSGTVRGRPARQFQQRRMPSLLVVGVIIAAALLISVVLISSLGEPSDPTTPSDTDAATTIVETTLAGPAVPVDGGWSSSDPDGDDRVENEESVALAHDGSGSTSWSTVCYANQYLGGKRGVGIVMTLSKPATGQLSVTFGASPWSAAVHVADELPASFEGWGAAIDSSYSLDAQTATFDIGTAATYVLISLQQLAEDPGCTASNPFRGRISEITFQPAP
ncbi:MAG: serine/threonine-protein kinase [Acidimicrobiia bacterium]